MVSRGREAVPVVPSFEVSREHVPLRRSARQSSSQPPVPSRCTPLVRRRPRSPCGSQDRRRRRHRPGLRCLRHRADLRRRQPVRHGRRCRRERGHDRRGAPGRACRRPDGLPLGLPDHCGDHRAHRQHGRRRPRGLRRSRHRPRRQAQAEAQACRAGADGRGRQRCRARADADLPQLGHPQRSGAGSRVVAVLAVAVLGVGAVERIGRHGQLRLAGRRPRPRPQRAEGLLGRAHPVPRHDQHRRLPRRRPR